MKKNKKKADNVKNSVNKYIKIACERTPDFLTGKSEIWDNKFRECFGDKDFRQKIEEAKIKIMQAYICLILSMIVFCLAWGVSAIVEREKLYFIERPDFGEIPKEVNLQVKATYEDGKLLKKMNLSVFPKALNEKEKKEALSRFSALLPEMILGKNKKLSKITKPLNLLETDEDTGIVLNWSTDCPEIISGKGEVNLLNISKDKKVLLSAELILEDVVMISMIPVTVVPGGKTGDYKNMVAAKLSELEYMLEDSEYKKKLILPKKLSETVSLEWIKNNNIPVGIIMLFLLVILFLVYQKRFDTINKEIKRSRESIAADFPMLMDKLVLLLNAGLVISTAVSKIAEDYKERKEENGSEGRILFDELCEIDRRVKDTNTPLLSEIKNFAKRSGVRELLRFSAILSENINKGATLSAKLENEGEMLWLTRKKRAEEKGRLAETKLTLPLMILLMVFIMITITPALMEL